MAFIRIIAYLLMHFILGGSAQIEHDNTPLNLYESRWLNQVPWPNPPGERCRLPAERYYIKKRLTRRRIQGRTLRYQFIASSADLGNGNRDTLALPGEPDHFAPQYGWIFCEMGVIMGLEMRLHARHCGIEELLVSLCTMDQDVNPGQGINLPLGRVFPADSTVINNQMFLDLTVDNCFKLIEVKLPELEIRNYDPERLLMLYGQLNPYYVYREGGWLFDLLEYYVEGLSLSVNADEQADNVVLVQRCGTRVTWRNYHIDDFRNSPAFVRYTYHDTIGESWYFCIPY